MSSFGLDQKPKQIHRSSSSWRPEHHDKVINLDCGEFQTHEPPLPVDVNTMEQRFKECFQFLNDQAGGCDRVDGLQMRLALMEAFAGLWHALGVSDKTVRRSSGTLRQKCPAGYAAAALVELQLRKLDAATAGTAIDAVLRAYLTLMTENLERWLDRGDPRPHEVADIAIWWLFDAYPALELFESGVESQLSAALAVEWRRLATDVEHLLLGSWETLSCDDVCRQVEAAFALARTSSSRISRSSSRRSFQEANETPCSQFSFGHGEQQLEPTASAPPTVADRVWVTLRGVIEEASKWRGHKAACERSCLVLIAALGCVKRLCSAHIASSLEGEVTTVVRNAQQQRSGKERSAGGSKNATAKSRMSKAKARFKSLCSRILEDIPCTSEPEAKLIPIEYVLEPAEMVAEFAAFSREAKRECEARGLTQPAHGEVLEAFAMAFENDISRLCALTFDTHFAARQQPVLQSLVLDLSSPPAAGMLHAVCKAAMAFWEEVFDNSCTLCRRLAAESAMQMIVGRWSDAIVGGVVSSIGPTAKRSSKPSVLISKPALVSAISADEASLLWMSRRFKDATPNGSPQSGAFMPPKTTHVLRVCQQFLLSRAAPDEADSAQDERAKLLADAHETMLQVLGVDRGAALLSAMLSIDQR
eukprot:TRINITY_DN27774_c0_g1_i1.p1 TRINITY_DN27774_c0_g1~~TRINITY_DN27774_c0_g1_i1.p1  ORF type:complete len:646 (-),score=152.04 TRINITY_DN27774_c0_g1_i1:84-2021(-)